MANSEFYSYFFDTLVSIISALIVAGVTGVILNKILIKERKIGKKLHDVGIEKATLGSGGIKVKDWKELLKLTKGKEILSVDLCFLTGRGFLVSNPEIFINLLKKGATINVALADPKGQFLSSEYEKCKSIDELKACHEANIDRLVDYYYSLSKDPSLASGFLERVFVMLESKKTFQKNEDEAKSAIRTKLYEDGEHVYQIYYVKQILKHYMEVSEKEKNTKYGTINLHYYKDQYRFPYVIINCSDKIKDEFLDYTYAWCNITPPAQEAYDAIRFYCARDNEESENFVSELKRSADYINSISVKVDL